MAIKKCPYCKAIIDENDKVCANCGTQLLYPEDEFIEEEIPGEKIEDEDFKPGEESQEEEITAEDSDSSLEDKEIKKAPDSIEEETEIESLEKGEKEEEKEIMDKSEGEVEEKIKEKEIEETILSKKESEEEGEEKEESAEFVPEDEEEQIEEEVKVPDEGTPEKEVKEEEKEEVPGFKKEGDFETSDLEKISSPMEIDEEKIEDFLKSIKEREEETRSLTQEKEAPSPSAGDMEEKKTETQEGLPLWAKKFKDTTSSEFPEEKKEKEEEKIPEFEEEFQEKDIKLDRTEKPPVETKIGIPEGDEQEGLPFIEEEKEKEGRFQPSSTLVLKLKAITFDFFFVTALWFLTIWLASRLIDVSLFKLIPASTLAIIIFYLILMFSYFSLFIFFLGETLGDRLFHQES